MEPKWEALNFCEFDSLGKDQDEYNLMAALSIIEDRLGK